MTTPTDKLFQKLAPHRKTAWKPVTEGNVPPATAQPALACPQCSTPMSLFLHLRAADLPADLSPNFHRHTGTMQVWYCTECDDWESFSKSHVLRVIPTDAADAADARNGQGSSIGNKVITGWEAVDDYPELEEASDWGCEFSEAEEEAFYALEEPNYPQSGDKLGGWPDWVQGVEYPACPECGEPMELVFQLDSEDHLDYMFGDTGCAHVTRCKNHPHQMALGWACY